MAVNYVNSGERIIYTVPQDTKVESGQVIVLQRKVFVSLGFGTSSDEITLSRTGRFALPKDGCDMLQAETLYWDSKNNCLTKISSGNIKAGIAAMDAPKFSKTVDCILISNV